LGNREALKEIAISQEHNHLNSTWIAQNVERKARNVLGHKFWAGGYSVSTIGRNKEMTCANIKNPEMADKLQLKLASP
jgi:putative transposase